MSHIPVMLHNLLDDLVFLVVEYTRAQVMLYLVLQDGVLLAYEKAHTKNTHYYTNAQTCEHKTDIEKQREE